MTCILVKQILFYNILRHTKQCGFTLEGNKREVKWINSFIFVKLSTILRQTKKENTSSIKGRSEE